MIKVFTRPPWRIAKEFWYQKGYTTDEMIGQMGVRKLVGHKGFLFKTLNYKIIAAINWGIWGLGKNIDVVVYESYKNEIMPLLKELSKKISVNFNVLILTEEKNRND